jgi:hypothetical protein
MTLPASGPISLLDVNVELGYSSTATISLNDAAVRTLFGVASGQISMSDGYGKSNGAFFILAWESKATPDGGGSSRGADFRNVTQIGSDLIFSGAMNNVNTTVAGQAAVTGGWIMVRVTSTGAYSTVKYFGTYPTGCPYSPYSAAASGNPYALKVNPVDGALYMFQIQWGYNANNYCGAPQQGFYYDSIRKFNASTLAYQSAWIRQFDTQYRGYNNGVLENVYFDASGNMYHTGGYGYQFLDYSVSYYPISAFGELFLKTSSDGSSLSYAKSTTRVNPYQYRESGTISSAQYSSTQVSTLRVGAGYRGQTSTVFYDYKRYNMSDGAIPVWYRATNRPSGTSAYMEELKIIDSSNNHYMALAVNQSSVLKGGVAKYNSSMVQQWNSLFNHSPANDYTLSCAVDSAGNVYMCGYSYMDFGSCIGYGYTATIYKTNSSGVLQWRRYLYNPGTATRPVFLNKIVVGGGGELLVMGNWQISTSTQYALGLRLNANGAGTGAYTIDGLSLTYSATAPAGQSLLSSSVSAQTYTLQSTQPVGYEIINVGTTSPTNYNWNLTTAQGQSLTNRQTDISANLSQATNYNLQIL